ISLGGDMVWLLGAALLHELGHGLAIWRCGGRLERLEIGLFGATMLPRFPTVCPISREMLILFGGPAAGLLAGALGLACHNERLALTNLALSGFNLLPIEGLDGGSLLRLALTGRRGPDGERLAGRIGALTLSLLLLGSLRFVWSATPMPALLLAGCYLLLSALLHSKRQP
ncbi:MAG: hypothetical protein RR197_06540, partial [Oscillospiraceae bacterium]